MLRIRMCRNECDLKVDVMEIMWVVLLILGFKVELMIVEIIMIIY